MKPADHLQSIEDFCKMMKEEINRPDLVLESKHQVDELACELANCARDFILKHENLKASPLLSSSVTYRAFHMLSHIIVPGWCMDAVGHKWLALQRKHNGKKAEI